MVDILIDVPDEDPTLPPAGRRTGIGSSSVLPYLVKTLSAQPQHEATVLEPRAARVAAAPTQSRE